MAEHSQDRRIHGWYFFDWASQPYYTVLLTFIFGPFFADIASRFFLGQGLDEMAADAQAQSLWSFCLTITGLIVAFTAPIMGALADTAGRRMPWIVGFSVLYVLGAAALWYTNPDGSNLSFALFAFGVGFIGAEYALVFTNAQLPGLTDDEEVGRVSGSGFAFGYLGGLGALIVVLALLVEQSTGKTVAGLSPAFGLLDPEAREGTRAAGPFVALWFVVFMIPYFLWMRDPPRAADGLSIGRALSNLTQSIRSLRNRPSLASFLGGSMLYRDAMNGLYGFGGTYALLVLDWEVTQVGVFGIIGAISAAAMSWVGGRLDRRFGPKPVVMASGLLLILVCFTIVNMSRNAFFGFTLAEASTLPDTVFMICGALIGGLGGVLQAASRSLMVRHTDLENATEEFGLYGLAGRATSFIAPAMIGGVTLMTGNVQYGVAPLILLFILGLLLLRWTEAEGDRS